MAEDPPSAGEKSFEAALEKLEGIVDELEGGQLSLEDSLKHYEQGMALQKQLSKTLDEAEKSVEKIAKDDKAKAEAEAKKVGQSAGEEVAGEVKDKLSDELGDEMDDQLEKAGVGKQERELIGQGKDALTSMVPTSEDDVDELKEKFEDPLPALPKKGMPKAPDPRSGEGELPF